MKKDKYIIIYSVLFIVSLYIIDQVFQMSYFYKVIFKLFMIAISYLVGKFFFNMSFNFLRFKKIRSYKKGLMLSLLAFSIIFIGFLIINNFMNFDILKNEFINKYKLTGYKFFIASFYLVVINSFIEEYFFRGFIFLNYKNRKTGNIFSSIMFSIYHISNFQNWFDNKFLLVIPITSLVIAGIIFNYLVSITDDIYNSYIPHMFADLAIVIIGFFLIIH